MSFQLSLIDVQPTSPPPRRGIEIVDAPVLQDPVDAIADASADVTVTSEPEEEEIEQEAAAAAVTPEGIDAEEQIAMFGVDRPVPITLTERFLVPPFTILDARQGYWMDRKRRWMKLGLNGHLGRPEAVRTGPMGRIARSFERAAMRGRAAPYKFADVSVFDPVLTELIYRWFTPLGGHILDPFAGGTTRGMVAAFLGFKYTGIDLRAEQIEQNRQLAEKWALTPDWRIGDSARLTEIAPGEYDLVFTSPPFFDLERYSTDPADGSNMSTYEEFLYWQEGVYRQATDMLRGDRFFVLNVTDIRNKETGAYRNWPGDTITCMHRLGLSLYNDVIFITPVATLAVRAGFLMSRSRKLGRAHQNILIFYKGDPKVVGKVWPHLKEVERIRMNEEDQLAG